MNNLIKSIEKILKNNKIDQYLTKKYFNYGLIAFSILLGFHLNWEIYNIVFFAFIIWLILYPISSQILAKIVLVFLLFTPLLLIINREEQAEQTAVFAYYFLVLMIIMTFIEIKIKKQKSIHEKQ